MLQPRPQGGRARLQLRQRNREQLEYQLPPSQRLARFLPQVERRRPTRRDPQPGKLVVQQFQDAADLRDVLGLVNEQVIQMPRQPLQSRPLRHQQRPVIGEVAIEKLPRARRFAKDLPQHRCLPHLPRAKEANHLPRRPRRQCLK